MRIRPSGSTCRTSEEAEDVWRGKAATRVACGAWLRCLCTRGHVAPHPAARRVRRPLRAGAFGQSLHRVAQIAVRVQGKHEPEQHGQAGDRSAVLEQVRQALGERVLGAVRWPPV
eukprot:4767259-Prymnesium_polylepis.1